MTDSLLDDSANDLPIVDETKDYVEELVGENKKFKTVADLARGKQQSDVYIKTLETKMDELRSDYLKERENSQATANLQKLIDQYEQKLASSKEPPANEDEKAGYDPKEIETLVSNKIKENELSKKQQENSNLVRTKLKERYGNSYVSVLKAQADELGLTDEDVDALARKSPKAFFKTMELDEPVQQDNFQTPPRSDRRNDNFAPKGQTKRTWSYYQDMKKTNPTLYHDPKINVQMAKDAVALGDDFKDGDYHKFGD